jgi:F-type H+-transporting ATPase subunit epsilon
MARTIHCSILTPEKAVYEGNAEAVYITVSDGECGILPGHAPMIAQLGVGPVRLINGSLTSTFEVEGGFAEITAEGVILLAEEAMKKEELSERHIRAELDELSASPRPTNRLEAGRYDRILKKLNSRLKIATR